MVHTVWGNVGSHAVTRHTVSPVGAGAGVGVGVGMWDIQNRDFYSVQYL